MCTLWCRKVLAHIHHQAKESSRSFRTALLLILATWLPGATARTAAQAEASGGWRDYGGTVWDRAQVGFGMAKPSPDPIALTENRKAG